MNPKFKSQEAETASSASQHYYSEPNMSFDFSLQHPGVMKLKTKYSEEFKRFKEERDLKTQSRLLKLDFIIRNTKHLNSILSQNSPEEEENQEKLYVCHTHR
jgi:hypothetical protein